MKHTLRCFTVKRLFAIWRLPLLLTLTVLLVLASGITFLNQAGLLPLYEGRALLTGIRSESGFAYIASIGRPAWSSHEHPSDALVLEDGKPLPGPANALHDEIRTLGPGRYSFWQSDISFRLRQQRPDHERETLRGMQALRVRTGRGWGGLCPDPAGRGAGGLGPRAAAGLRARPGADREGHPGLHQGRSGSEHTRFALSADATDSFIEFPVQAGETCYITIMPFDAYGESVGRMLYPVSNELKVVVK